MATSRPASIYTRLHGKRLTLSGDSLYYEALRQYNSAMSK